MIGSILRALNTLGTRSHTGDCMEGNDHHRSLE